jgi:hypothetical protein
LKLWLVFTVVVLLNLLHPLFHGTPLDGGALDGLLQSLDVWALSYGSTR